MAKRPIPEINSSSMADIAFMLLIFFLVATTMDTNKGLFRTLPPFVEQQQKEEVKVNEKNLFVVFINKDNNLMVEKKPARIEQLRKQAVDFLSEMNEDQTDNSCPGFTMKNIPLLGNQKVTKAIISIQNDRGTSYEKYIEIQNEIVAAYNIVKNKYANKYFRKDFDKLNEDEQKAISELIPQKISEAEPKSIGGK